MTLGEEVRMIFPRVRKLSAGLSHGYCMEPHDPKESVLERIWKLIGWAALLLFIIASLWPVKSRHGDDEVPLILRAFEDHPVNPPDPDALPDIH